MNISSLFRSKQEPQAEEVKKATNNTEIKKSPMNKVAREKKVNK